jgi:SAM-dependent methyltransferase
MTFGCLKRANEMMAESGASQRFRPWFFIEQHPANFKVVRLDDVPEYPMELAEQIRQSSASRERDCGGCTAFTYEFLRQFLQPSDKLLDLGCGLGDGAASIADAVHEVRGADYDPLTVAEAGARHSTVANLTFDVEDAQALSYPDGTFDVAVSSNSMEHVPNDTLMLANLLRVLRPGGILILEVPLLAERPFGVPLLPSHLREYRPTPLLELVRRAGFKVIHQYGVNRGVYVDWDQAREAALIVAQKTAAESGEGV